MTKTASSRAEAKALDLIRYFTGRPCLRGHLSERHTKTGACLACQKVWNVKGYKKRREWVAKNLKTVREYHRKFAQTEKGRANTKRKNSSPTRKAYLYEWRAKNLERSNEATRRHYWKNVAASRAAQNTKHRENPAWSRSRERRIKQATPIWVNRQAIIAIYAACPPGHEVDHIVPITHKMVCGMHVPWNLQYLPMRENRSKHNKHE